MVDGVDHQPRGRRRARAAAIHRTARGARRRADAPLDRLRTYGADRREPRMCGGGHRHRHRARDDLCADRVADLPHRFRRCDRSRPRCRSGGDGARARRTGHGCRVDGLGGGGARARAHTPSRGDATRAGHSCRIDRDHPGGGHRHSPRLRPHRSRGGLGACDRGGPRRRRGRGRRCAHRGAEPAPPGDRAGTLRGRLRRLLRQRRAARRHGRPVAGRPRHRRPVAGERGAGEARADRPGARVRSATRRGDATAARRSTAARRRRGGLRSGRGTVARGGHRRHDRAHRYRRHVSCQRSPGSW